MKFCRIFLFILFVVYSCFCLTFAISNELMAFHRAVNEATEQLQSIKSSIGVEDDDNLLRERRHSIDELLANFQKDVSLADEIEAGSDETYRQIRDKDCKSDKCGGGGSGGVGIDWKTPSLKFKKKINLDEEIEKLHAKYKNLNSNSNLKDNKMSNKDLVTYFSSDNDHVVANINPVKLKDYDSSAAIPKRKIITNVNMKLSGKIDNKKGDNAKLKNTNTDLNTDTNSFGNFNYNNNLDAIDFKNIDSSSNIKSNNKVSNSNSNNLDFNNKLDAYTSSGSATFNDAIAKPKSNINSILLLEADTFRNMHTRLDDKDKYKYDSFDTSKEPNNYDPDKEANEDVSYEKTIENIHFPSIINDRFDLTRNDLSHEANYKLSKIEQDAAEKRKMPLSWFKSKNIGKRESFNAMAEIKLKTASRLMRKGYGASLPSSSLYDNRREMMIDDMVKKMEEKYTGKPKHEEYDKLDTLLSLDDLQMPRLKRLDELQDVQLPSQSIYANDMNDKRLSQSNSEFDQSDASEDLPLENQFIHSKRYSDMKEQVRQQLESLNSDALFREIEDGIADRKQRLSEHMDEAKINSLLNDLTVNAQSEGDEVTIKEKRCGESKKSGQDDAADPNAILKTKTKRENADVDQPKKRVKRIGIINDMGEMTDIKEMEVGYPMNGGGGGDIDISNRIKRESNVVAVPVCENDAASPKRKKRTAVPVDGGGGTNTSNQNNRATNVAAPAVSGNTALSQRRKKRSVVDEDQLFQGNNYDAEMNEDAANVRVKRSAVEVSPSTLARDNVVLTRDSATLKAYVTLTKNSVTNTSTTTHKIRKRSAHLVDGLDDNNSNNHKLGNTLAPINGGDVVREEDYEDITARKKRITGKDFDFGVTASEFGNQKFDNLKQKDDNSNNFEGLKIDNLWYDNNNNNNKDNNNNAKDIQKDKEHNENNKRNDNSVVITSDNENDGSTCGKTNDSDNDGDNKNNSSDPNKPNDGSEESKLGGGANGPVDQKMIIALRDQILNCTAFSSLENFLKSVAQHNKSETSGSSETGSGSGSSSGSSSSSSNKEKIDMNVSPNPIDTTTSSSPGKAEATTSSSPTTESQSQSAGSTTNAPPGKKEDMMKLNITINASVMGDQKAKSFYGNGTISVQSSDRERRRATFGQFEKLDTKRKCPYKPPSCGGENGNPAQSSKIVKSIFGLVRCNPKLKVLWPSLKRNQQMANQQTQSSNAMSSMESESGGGNPVEEMVQKAMEAINEIIQEQVQSRSCMPIRPDLKDFYELILQIYEEQDNGREKRESAAPNTASDFSKEVRAIDPNGVEEKSRIVKKLLRQYEDLPQEDQQQVTAIRDDLLKNLMYLRQVKDEQDLQQERRKRDIMEEELKASDSDLVKKMEADYTPEFLKLVKTSELLREVATDQEQT